MSDTFTITNDRPSVDSFAALYLDAGWLKEADEAKLEGVIENTSRWWTARDNTTGQIIGIGRVLTDWGRCACIYDVIVFSGKQKNGVGTAIMKAIIHELVEAKIDIIHLWPSRGKVPFYERLGFTALSREQPMMKYQQKY